MSSSGYRDSSDALSSTSFTPRAIDDGGDLFAGESPLAVGALVGAVLERNPSVELARQGWRHALALYPSASSLSDPTLTVTVAPLSLFDPDVKVGVGAQLRQPLPFPGKRRLRGEVVLAEADAARADYRAVRQRLALMAAQLYYDFYLVERAIEINGEHLGLLGQYGKLVDGYLATSKAWQEDALKIDVDLAELKRLRATLLADRDVVIAQLNAMLHREPRTPIPSPPAALAAAAKLSRDRAALSKVALDKRPELSAVASRIRGASAKVSLADREYYPDLAIMGSYNRMWPSISHQVMVGLSIDLPVTRGQRAAALDSARAMRSRSRADRDRVVDGVLRDVETAYRRIGEADEAVVLYRDRVLPAASGRVDAIRIGLDAGRTTFVEVIRAERQLRDIRLRMHAALADAHRYRARLRWAIGERPGGPSSGGGK